MFIFFEEKGSNQGKTDHTFPQGNYLKITHNPIKFQLPNFSDISATCPCAVQSGAFISLLEIIALPIPF